MKSLTRGHIKAGLDSVRGAKIRNFWTMLGVIIGVSSVITIVSIGEGVKQQISLQVHRMGKDLITVQPTQLNVSAGTSNNASLLSGYNITGSLNAQDVTVVSTTKGVAYAAPLSAVSGNASGEKGSYTRGLVMGTTSTLPSLLNQSLRYGGFITDEDSGLYVAVLGSEAARGLFNDDIPLGDTFSFRGHNFIVRGIFNEFNVTSLSEQTDFNNAIFIPYDVSQSMTNNTAPTYQILVRPTNPKDTAKVTTTLKQSLRKAHGGSEDFSVLQQNQNLVGSNQVVDLLTRLIAGVAAISLLVGGIGIMNVMLVSVAERMHEIGIRKAVGATNRQILSQFVIEATFLSLTGGLIGIALSFAIEGLLRAFTELEPVITWQVVVIATGVSLLVGIIFGSVPALKAARKPPIEALRSE